MIKGIKLIHPLFFDCSRWKHFLPIFYFDLLLAIVCSCHIMTLKSYPIPWGDEVQLIEMGRCAVFEPNTDWSTILRPGFQDDKIRPEILPTFIGGAVSELIYRTTGAFWAHRLFSILGLLTASILCYRWLCRKNFSPWIAGCVSLLFCTDDNITRSAHFYRPDLWILAMTFWGALQITDLKGKAPQAQCKRLFFLGVLLAFQLLYWFSAVFCWPLILAELIVLSDHEKWSKLDFCKRIVFLASGGVSGLSIFLFIPNFKNLPTLFSTFLEHPDFNAFQVPSVMPNLWHSTMALVGLFAEHIKTLITLLIFSPFFWLLSAIGFICSFHRNRVFAAFFLLTGLVIVATHVYCFRVIYFFPFCVLFAAAGLEVCLNQAKTAAILHKATIAYCCVALLIGFAVSVFGLNLIAGCNCARKDSARWSKLLENAIGRNAKRVYVFSFQPYFAGRELGWHQYSFLPRNQKYIFKKEAAHFLHTMDYILVQERSDSLTPSNEQTLLTEEEATYLRENGFQPVSAINIPNCECSKRMFRLRNHFYAWEYAPHTVWKNICPPSH